MVDENPGGLGPWFLELCAQIERMKAETGLHPVCLETIHGNIVAAVGPERAEAWEDADPETIDLSDAVAIVPYDHDVLEGLYALRAVLGVDRTPGEC